MEKYLVVLLIIALLMLIHHLSAKLIIPFVFSKTLDSLTEKYHCFLGKNISSNNTFRLGKNIYSNW